ncbi:hypothetical protein Tco_0434425 [Tanacetum coccineum]
MTDLYIGQRFSLNKSSTVHEKPNTPRSCLRWIPTGRIFKLAGLSSGLALFLHDRWRLQKTLQAPFLKEKKVSLTTYVPPSKRDYEILFQPLFDEYFNPPPCAVSPDPVAVAAPRPVDLAGSPLSTTIDQDVPSASTSPTNQEIQFQVTQQVLKNKFMKIKSYNLMESNVIHTFRTWSHQCDTMVKMNP